jgi:hypothetical protein
LLQRDAIDVSRRETYGEKVHLPRRIISMAWYRNHQCYRCDQTWEDEWSCGCDDECPCCEARHVSPIDSEDLTFIIEEEGHSFVVLKSPDEAEYHPDYRELIRFLSRDIAEAYVRAAPPVGIV